MLGFSTAHFDSSLTSCFDCNARFQHREPSGLKEALRLVMTQFELYGHEQIADLALLLMCWSLWSGFGADLERRKVHAAVDQ